MRHDIECRTQAELAAALKMNQDEITIHLFFSGRIEAWGSSQPHVVAWGSSQPHVVARESSQPHVEARGSSQPHVEAWESSQPHVVAWESSQPHVVAREWVSLVVSGKCVVSLTKNCTALLLNFTGKISGKGLIRRLLINTVKKWLDYHGATVTSGVATLYKCVDDKFTTDKGTDYTPGQTPVAPDWDGGKNECGGGLHFCAQPGAARGFYDGKKFVAVPVRVKDMRKPRMSDEYPTKIKARGACGPTIEVDVYGKPVETKKE